jgi:signal transduction histidine kinase
LLKKSLYLRIVGTFICIVIISLIVSYLLTYFFFHGEVVFEEEMLRVSEGVVDLIDIAEEDKIYNLINTLNHYNFKISILNEDGDVSFQGDRAPYITADMVLEVFQRTKKIPAILPHSKRDATRIVGVPISINNERYALFIAFNYKEEFAAIKRVIMVSLLLVLVVGSLLILLASRNIVKPIKKLTLAAKQMATGNFSVRLKSKNKDEVGELITTFNHMATELEKIDKMREDFVSNVSHEIQSPLTSIRGFTKAIRDDVVPKQNQKEYLDIIYQETERLSRLSENLLRLASLDSEHHPYHPVLYRLDEQVRRSVLATEPLWKQKNLQLHLDLKKQEVFADQDLLEEVWLNLITNAIKYSHYGGLITITMKKANNEIVVSVRDTGKGIPKEFIPNLFDRFYKVDKARRSSVAGNGLGLSIVKRILSIHQFSIAVSSEEGNGSIFKVRIPDHKEH